MTSGYLQQLRDYPLVFVDDLGQPTLTERDFRHLTKSLRLRVGQRLAASDGAGQWRWVKMSDGSRLELDGDIAIVDLDPGDLTIAFALVKGDRSDLIVQKATELGINRIVPVHTARSVARWDQAKAAKNNQRHQRIAREAAMQSRSLWLPEVQPVTELSQLLEDAPNAVMAEPGGPPMAAGVSPKCVVIGPEGGFAPQELAGRATVGIPGNILRSETAAIAAAVLIRSGAASSWYRSC